MDIEILEVRIGSLMIVPIANVSKRSKLFLVVSPTVLIRNGNIDKGGLKRERLTVNELLGKLREKGYADPKDIDLALIEESGQISVIPKSEARPVQPRDLNLETKRNFVPIPLILDGEIIEHNLKYLKKTKEWLFQKLEDKGIEQAMLASDLGITLIWPDSSIRAMSISFGSA